MFLIRSMNMYLIWVIMIKKENNGEYPIYCLALSIFLL